MSDIDVIIKRLNIRSLNDVEQQSIRNALQFYVDHFGEKKAWSQKVILDDMLTGLLWCDKLEI